jgi:hypothetical protein
MAAVIRSANSMRSTVSAGQEQRPAGAELVHLQLEQAVRVLRVFALEGVGADDLAQPVGLMRRRAAHRAHLVQRDVVPPLRELVRRLAPREPAADDGDCSHAVQLSPELDDVVLSPGTGG